ncbi:DUF3413 domain-containing protein [Shewanella surugensis]|uniref:DUF3413 domain-containing protein n=1 Tax=Shewanella surugensis TaxID=212020 RepID=A0ABT0LFK1_9GAMM|nr:DUF3413 domain-containing protein [Shewanella surugensis]MCL1126440.1 DUF3413 domain-containing protein [Shewanella surugensis]
MVEQEKQIGRDRVSHLINWGHWFAFFNGFLAMIVGLRYLESVGYPDTFIGWGYLFLLTVGQFSFLSFIVYLVCLFPITLLLPYSKILRGLAAVVATLGLCLLLYDTIIYDDYGVHLSPFIFDLAWINLSALLHGTSYIVTPIAILIIELVAANFIWKRIRKISKMNMGNKVVAFVGICFVGSHLIHIWGDATDITEITRFDDAYPLSYPTTARSLMESYGIDSRSSHNTQNPRKNSLNYPISPLQCHNAGAAYGLNNVLLIAIDSFRADIVDEHSMPFFTEYSNNNQNYNSHLSGGNQFDSGMFSLLYGLQGNYISANDLHYESPLMTQTFKKQGYQLGLFSGHSLNNQPQAIFDDFTLVPSSNINGAAEADLNSIKHFNQWKNEQQSPWFALVNLTAPDSYDTPIGFLGIKTVKSDVALKPAQKVLFNQYRQSLNFIDNQLKAILKNVPKNTLVIITGVSGKMLTSNTNEARVNLMPQSVDVPFVIHWPDQKIPSTIPYRTSHYGLVPTLMSQVLGCTDPASDYSAGRTLVQPSSEPWVYVGDNRIFAIYQKDEITVIDRHGKYRIYDKNYQSRLDKKMRAEDLIQVMNESQRFHNH